MTTQNADPNAHRRLTIEPHGHQVVPWRQSFRSGSFDDRTLREVTVSMPPRIADFAPRVPAFLGAAADEALTAVTRLDSMHGDHLKALAVFLLRAESVASSKIEYIEASMDDFARASHGIKTNASASSMVASAQALESLIASVDANAPITLSSILHAHQLLFADDFHERGYAGKLRNMQNWIGGSDYAPRNALYVPPPADTVPGYLDDLLEFVNRDDVPALVHIAVAHAQFESIHPFTDGNGRIGRALVNMILRRRGVTSRVVVPIATALVARRDAYFDALSAYRNGDASPILWAFARAARIAARESEVSAKRLHDLPNRWLSEYVEVAGRPPRAGSATRLIMEQLLEVPFFSTEDLERRIGGAVSSVYSAIESLTGANILRPLTNRQRRQVWCAGEVIDELEDLGNRVASLARSDDTWSL